uniref:exodeoxyribonuclease III n=1 Tax=Gouania willdenowi TaxID=441366 RepID=A0A8C5EXJ1_GOUWI
MNFFFLYIMISFFSQNARGLPTEIKMRGILGNKANVLFLQETKWDCGSMIKVKSLWRGPVFYNNGQGLAGGVAILVREGVFDEINCLYKDDEGRLLVVEGLKGDRRYRLINIYAPNKVMERKRVFGEVGRWCNNETIMMGDFNVILTSDDVSGASRFFPDSSRSLIFKLLKEKNMEPCVDPIPMMNSHPRYAVLGVCREKGGDRAAESL